MTKTFKHILAAAVAATLANIALADTHRLTNLHTLANGPDMPAANGLLVTAISAEVSDNSSYDRTDPRPQPHPPAMEAWFVDAESRCVYHFKGTRTTKVLGPERDFRVTTKLTTSGTKHCSTDIPNHKTVEHINASLHVPSDAVEMPWWYPSSHATYVLVSPAQPYRERNRKYDHD
ncbi:hypothetical protein [Quatrionicoccus australiensis]|uniref:hypothetical protein n=1 Tax=Quatrionicoccus australiensis TaxID=138118 RepID=UPI001CFB597A|nr:hypothetical protein [Quatrionicoccus australiensis]MCB4359561.1 hypothetical protein [Quatrionicoccus australiensis]